MKNITKFLRVTNKLEKYVVLELSFLEYKSTNKTEFEAVMYFPKLEINVLRVCAPTAEKAIAELDYTIKSMKLTNAARIEKFFENIY